MRHKVFIGIGSNLNKIKNIKSCISKIKNDYENIKLSPVYETRAMGFDGPNFYIQADASFVGNIDTLGSTIVHLSHTG